MSVEIQGVEQFAALAKRLKDAGDKELSKEFSRAISAATRPLIRGLRQSARDTLPGDLGERVAKSNIRTQRRVSSRTAGLRIVAKNAYVLAKLDGGTVRHPVFGNREAWVNQRVKPGWWTTPTELAGKSVETDVLAAMRAIAKKLDARL